MTHGRYLLGLDACADEPAANVGGKALGLGKLMGFDLPVPHGFVVTADAYRHGVQAAGLLEPIAAALEGVQSAAQARAASAQIAELFTDEVLTAGLREDITAAYEQIGAEEPVAVRSSATAEDLADASFAGQQETYLWICGASEVLGHVVRCWASLFTAQAIQYRARLTVAPEDLAMAVVVQRMVPAASAGVMMTLEPVTGDRSTVYVEAAYGLGEGVVRGDVGVDRWWWSRDASEITRQELGHKQQAHRVDLERREVVLADVAEDERDRPCLTEAEVAEIAELGVRIEAAFGAPMDVEWALDGDRTVHLVQARPETVWSQRETTTEPDAWDTTHQDSPRDIHWTTTNVGEAMPGVLTPLSWSVWQPVGRALSEVAYAVGAISGAERRSMGKLDAQPMRIFHGRAAFQLEFFAMLGDRLPGTTGPEAAASLMGRVPEDIVYRPTTRRYPFVAWRMPRTFARAPREVQRAAADTAAWYRDSIERVPTLNRRGATSLLGEAQGKLVDMVTLQTVAVVAGIQPVYDTLAKLVERAGVGDVASLSGASGAEMLGMVGDLWKVSRDELDLGSVVRKHGFHGPLEGELSSRVWREDASPLERLVTEYARRDASEDPTLRERARRDEATRLRPRLLAALPAAQRPIARLVLSLAASRLPLRGVVKVSLLQAFDVARAAARHIGTVLHAEGLLDDPDDVFYLTIDELREPLPADAKDLVAKRRRRRADNQQLELPSDWSGVPEPIAIDHTAVAGDDDISGIGVSAGVVEGLVRVVTDPGQDIEPDEILVAPTTDPSWSSIMFVSTALVVDIGGALSHAAVVARELGIPCVVNTRTGTRALRTGDRVRVDGRAGTVQVLERAAARGTETAGSR